MHLYQYDLAEKGIDSWALKVKLLLLYNYGFGFRWLKQNVGTIIMFLKVFKQRCVVNDK